MVFPSLFGYVSEVSLQRDLVSLVRKHGDAGAQQSPNSHVPNHHKIKTLFVAAQSVMDNDRTDVWRIGSKYVEAKLSRQK